MVELTDVNRQVLCTEHDLGRPEVDVAVEVLRRHDGEVEVTGERTTVDGVGVLRRLAAGCDVLLRRLVTRTPVAVTTQDPQERLGRPVPRRPSRLDPASSPPTPRQDDHRGDRRG
ncbi:hypothetical protein ACFV4N_22725 [Actinosynnema sp. NPDC059797]